MKIYSVHSRAGDPIDRAIFVAEGFSGGAAGLTVLWALRHRMWLAAAVLFAIFAALASSGLGEGPVGAGFYITCLIFGFEAQSLRAWSLARSGYDQVGLTHGDNLEEAELRFYLACKTEVPPSPSAAKFRSPADTLGLFGNV